MVQFTTEKAIDVPGPTRKPGRADLQTQRQFEAYVLDLEPDEAGRLTPEGDETTRSLAMRVYRAARRVGKTSNCWTRDGVVYFVVS